MINCLRCYAVILFALLISACAIQPYNHIDRDARTHFKSVDAYLVVTQDEIYADIIQSTSGAIAGGLIGAMIDVSINNSHLKEAEELIAPITENLNDYDFASILTGQINTRLQAVDWLNTRELVLERTSSDGQLGSKLKACNSSAVLFMDADYKFSVDFSAVITRVNMKMFANKAELQKFRERLDDNENPVNHGDNIYRNVITATIPLGIKGEKEEIVKSLAKDDCSAVKAALEKSAAKVADQIYNDIILDETADKKKPT